MVTVPPPILPPVALPLPGSALPPPVIIPAQVVAVDLTNQLLRELTLTVTAATATQAVLPVSPANPAPLPATVIPAAPAAPAPAPILLQLQTAQGTLQLSLPQALPLQPAGPGQPAAPVPASLTAAQWQQLANQGHLQIQLSPVPAALLQRLAPGSPAVLAQLLIQPRDLARLLGVPATTATPLPQTGIGIGLGSAPGTYTATILPATLAYSYKARFAAQAALPNATPQSAASASNNIMQNAAASIRTWFDAPRSATPPSTAITAPRLEPSLQTAVTPPPTAASNALPDAPRQVTLTLRVEPSPLAPQAPAPLQTQARMTPSPVPANPAATADITARLLGTTPSGEKLLETDAGHVLLAPASLPAWPGRPVALRMAPFITAATGTLPPGNAPTLATSHPALDDALATLAVTAPALATRLAGQMLLQPTALAPAMLFLFAAMGMNAASGLPNTMPNKPNTGPSLTPALREALDVSDSPRPATALGPAAPLAERLLAELRQLGAGRTVTDDAGQPWRGHTLPTQTGDLLQTPINFYIQQPQPRPHDHQQRNTASTPTAAQKQTRFIVDMQLSKLGPTQLEGLSRARQLDLTLRTRATLPSALQAELTARYAEIAAATGLTGALQFGAGRWFTPRELANQPQVDARL